jgi:HTH-type transcriptional regulator/antitoxin HigA
MSATLLDERKYLKLLGSTLPVVIQEDAEYHRLLSAVALLMEKPEEDLSEEEGRLLELLSLLVEEYEDRVNPLPKTQPHKMLAYLLEEKA